jgi:hypothetical protein
MVKELMKSSKVVEVVEVGGRCKMDGKRFREMGKIGRICDSSTIG